MVGDRKVNPLIRVMSGGEMMQEVARGVSKQVIIDRDGQGEFASSRDIGRHILAYFNIASEGG